jgi:hypothetical protein
LAPTQWNHGEIPGRFHLSCWKTEKFPVLFPVCREFNQAPSADRKTAVGFNELESKMSKAPRWGELAGLGRGRDRWKASSVDVPVKRMGPTPKASSFCPRRWIVERTLAWLGRCRRLAQGFGMPQPQGARLPPPRLHPPHGQKICCDDGYKCSQTVTLCVIGRFRRRQETVTELGGPATMFGYRPVSGTLACGQGRDTSVTALGFRNTVADRGLARTGGSGYRGLTVERSKICGKLRQVAAIARQWSSRPSRGIPVNQRVFRPNQG